MEYREAKGRKEPTEVVVPQINAEEFAKRATIGVNTAFSAIIKPPAPKEITAVQKLFNEYDKTDDSLARALKEYSSENPDSQIAKYWKLTNKSTDWMIVNGKFGFNRKALETSEYLVNAKMAVTANMINFADPKTRESTQDLGRVSVLAPELKTELSKQFTSGAKGTKSLPVRIDEEDGSLRFTSLAKPPEQRETFQ
ncbi:hypothetical protein HZC07_01630 [Candidatus Micrarchaeota archaeon]|nr:hypothetical protein [Candidatus Micrarchaeota archaeon]